MSWFAPKILKSEYDKVLAEKMEHEINYRSLLKEYDDLKKEAENLEKEIKRLRVDALEFHIGHSKNNNGQMLRAKPNREKLKTIYEWRERFTPFDLIRFLLEVLHESSDIKKVGSAYYKNGERLKVAEVLADGRLKVAQKFVLDCYVDLSYNKEGRLRMPQGSLIHLYNAGLIEVSHQRSYNLFNFPIGENRHGFILTHYAVSIYKED